MYRVGASYWLLCFLLRLSPVGAFWRLGVGVSRKIYEISATFFPRAVHKLAVGVTGFDGPGGDARSLAEVAGYACDDAQAVATGTSLVGNIRPRKRFLYRGSGRNRLARQSRS